MTKILIADDETNILTLAGAMFKEQGMSVLTAKDGQEAITLALQEKPDILITDIIMPNKSGFEVCHAIRNTPDIADMPIIILSALGGEFNKLTGFEEGADDYVTKPFKIEELKARVNALLFRYKSRHAQKHEETLPLPLLQNIELVPTGMSQLDTHLFGGLPKGSNILVSGPLGKGKSTFIRKFVAEGILKGERSLFVALDDDPKRIRAMLDLLLPNPAAEYEQMNAIRFVDAYSWSTFSKEAEERFSINGALDLNQLSGVISDASFELGHSVQRKLGGRRVIDSISSLLTDFDLPSVQRFLNQITRTSLAFGGVTTLFVLEEGTVSEQVINNVKYIMDGYLEFSELEGHAVVRVGHMKWSKYHKQWEPIF